MTTRNSYHSLLTASLIFLLACSDKSDGSWMTPNGQNGTSTETESNDSLTDYDGDGYTSDEDCDDADGTINPGEIEVCDGTDNNCDGVVDEGLTETYYGDSDGDGFGDAASTEELCEPLSGYVPVDGDCDDTDVRYHPGAAELCSDPEDFNCDGVTEFIDEDGDGFAACEDCDDDNGTVNPDAAEVCDGEDNNCDGTTDEGFDEIQTWYADTDGDTYGHSSNSTDACEQPSGYVADNTDCLDTDANTNPGAEEVCDDLDNDCDGTIDEDPIDRTTWYADTDGDTYGDSSTTVLDCDQPSGYVTDDTDCDDGDASISPAATEVCDDIDNDCDGDTDSDAIDRATWYADTDGDTYGDSSTTTLDCDQPSGYVSDDTDCDDGVTAINPAAAEVCDELDNDCDGTVDEDDAADVITWYADDDGDGYGDLDDSVESCSQPSDYVTDSTDCDDDEADAYPSNTEVCDDLDNDCDGDIDEDDAADADTWYADTDGDTYGDASSTTLSCEEPSGYVADDTDCDDDEAASNPGETEVCDDLDNDCDGDTDEDDAADADTWYADTDGDTYGDASSTTLSCEEPSGYVADDTDCDDAEPASYPSNTEICDGIDNDCDGDTDEDDASDVLTWYADTDGDGYGDPDDSVESCSQPSGYVADSTDCNDSVADAFPGNTEVCDSIDNDCDGTVDEDDAADASIWYADTDGDTYGDVSSTTLSCDQPSGYVSNYLDCDDAEAEAYPSNTEVCDGIDNDCDGTTDEDAATDAATWYADTDGDTFGERSSTTRSCEQPSGYVADDTDCDDADGAINPDATEVCDSTDNDCDGTIDEDDAADAATWYADVDSDTYGDPLSSTESCERPTGYVADDTDCDDDAAAVNPAATELCDNVDNDCDGVVDEDDAANSSTWYADADGDTFGDAADTTDSCDQPAGYVADDADCDDDNNDVNPAATEICNEIDDNCNGDIDDDDSGLDPSTGTTWYADTDVDTYGDVSNTVLACEQPSGFVADSDDCDDADTAVNPDATEVCDSIDNDCDGTTDEDDAADATTWYGDADGDTYGGTRFELTQCSQPSNYVANDTDCDDSDAAINPSATEVCNGEDDDCDGSIDEDSADDAAVWYADIDGDGYGDSATSATSCEPASGYVSDDTDCDDGDSAVNPAATEVCDGIDNDCDTTTDEDDAADAATWYADTDGDTYGDLGATTEACEEPSGYVADSDDCDDADAAINPAATEVCDAADNDCDGSIDEDSADDASVWYADTDGDGYGDSATSATSCEPASGYVADDTDCDDDAAAVNPAATEICNEIDDDCDSAIDDDDGSLDSSTGTVFYADDDGDTYGDVSSTTQTCTLPSGYVTDTTDCDDSAAAVNPAATEICDSIDNDCDSLIDDDDSSLDSSTGAIFYADTDGDTYGDSSSTVETCTLPSGYVADDTDCDDGAAAVNPSATEVCDSIDNDCDTLIDDDDGSLDSSTGTVFYADDDGDTYGDVSSTTQTCTLPSGYVSDTTDCDDSAAAVNPAATEICDSIDNDCDTLIDDDDASVDTSTGAVYYADTDGDTYGDLSNTIDSCSLPSGYVADDTDCDDGAAAVNPAATEICDSIDNDCDTLIDDDDASVDTSTGAVYYADTDGDTYGDLSNTIDSCSLPSGYVTDTTDCDDGDAAVNPAATEVCDSIDNDCDTLIDDDDSSVDSSTGAVYYADTDGDAYGDASNPIDSCSLPSGYVVDDTDCDDGAAAVNPAATEICDSIDNDCDTLIDDDDAGLDASTGTTWYADTDGDTYGDISSTTQTCTLPGGYVSDDTDCDDGAAAVNPAATEICDSIDNDCDSLIDDDDSSLDSSTGAIFYADTDGDTYGDSSSTVETCTLPSGYVSDDTDCDDGAAAVNPAATEICDSIDNDCDSLVDDDDSSLDSSTGTTWYADSDGDTYGDSSSTVETCTLPSGYVSDDTDCDDGAAAVNPAATEICDSIDNDCDSLIDDDDSSLDSSTGAIFYADTDGDTYGDSSSTVETCDLPSGYVSDDTDCDDGAAAVNPAATEICDSIDNDCDSLIDDDDSSLDSSTGTIWYADSDGDTYGDISSTTQTCDLPSGYVSDDTDCDDGAAAVNPAATEVCDSIDNDCDSLIDDDDSSLDSSTGTTWYADSDGDTYGDISSTTQTCDLPSGYVSDDTDCDDGAAAVNPAATEICDSIDNDCDSLVDDDDSSLDASTGTVFYADSDGDTYGDSSSTTQTCTLPSGYVSDDDDCDDGDAAINPAATEVCDGDDNDCDGDIDDDDSSLDASTGSTFYADSDGDGYGNASSSVETCEEPGSYVSDSTDCDDGDGNINPAATEVCDGDDNDCDSLIDDDDSSLDASTGTTWYADSDGDTYGDISSTTQTCDLPSGYVSDDDDCDDGDATQYPGADEYCNSEDDDCDGTTDEDAVDGSDFYIDDDEDGFGDPSATEWACDGITNNYDCNDADSAEPVMVDISAGSASGAGTIDDPLDAIQDGIDSANECVVVAEGTYSEAIDFSGKDLEVIGVDGPDNTIIDASGLGTPVVTFASGEQGWLEGFTLLSGDGYLESTSSSYACTSITTCTDYYDTYAGGGIYIDGADPTVVNVIIEANYLPTASTTVSGNDTYYVNSFGGGIYISSGTLIADGLAILENEADQGGGVYLDPSSVLTMDASWVIGNGAEDGGGVEVDGGDAQLTNVASIWNMADSDGGGILLIDAALEATNVMWGGDDATTGGGLYVTGTSSATVMNSIITESGSAEGVLVGGSASFSGSYNNVYNNAGGDYSGISDPTGSSGNLSTSVGFSAWSDDGTYTNENISLTTSSAMIGAGNPSSTYDNADSTTNDIGALGGPSSDWDDGVPGLN